MINLRKILIIGAGASGVYLSVILKQRLKKRCEVIVLEQKSSPLKKLLATGNGRCNLSHRNIDETSYQSDNQELVKDIVTHFDMVEKMFDLGLYCVYQGDLLYPKSEQALSVKQVLMNAAIDNGVQFHYDEEVLSISYQQGYQVKTSKQSYFADDVVLSMGSEAGKLSGENTSRYDILRNLGLKVVDVMPSLVQMNTSPVIKSCKGVRVKGTFSLLENNQVIHKEKGELLLTDYGVSGIAIMQLSAFCKKNHQYELSINFFDELDQKKLYEYIELRMNKRYNHFYDGLFNSKLSLYFEKMNLQSVQDIVNALTDFRLKVVSLRSYETAQVMKGGLSMHEVDKSLQMKKYPHMYAIGEILNVAGMCGGYNLHFAFASAYHVAKAIEREIYAKNP